MEAAGEAVLEKPETAERSDVPVAYIFDGWNMVPLEVQPRA